MQNFDVYFDRRLNKQLSKQSRRRWFETPSRSLCRYCNGNGNSCSLPATIGRDISRKGSGREPIERQSDIYSGFSDINDQLEMSEIWFNDISNSNFWYQELFISRYISN